MGAATRTIPYTYGDAGWKDKLTAYDGTPISYDAIDNPVNDGTWAYTWQAGRQLTALTGASDSLAFTYNAGGLRVRKVSQSRGVTEYTLRGKQIAHQKRGTEELHFWYGAQEKPIMVSYGGKDYYYVYNVQGDVVALLDSTNSQHVVTYVYDAWGKQVSCTGTMAATLGKENPFRYRGYVYDEETGLYYLRSRYYNPQWGRFVNADTLLGKAGALISTNAFTYCLNSPIIMVDPNGKFVMGLIGIAKAITSVITVATKALGAAAAVVGGLAISDGITNAKSRSNANTSASSVTIKSTTRTLEDTEANDEKTSGKYFLAYAPYDEAYIVTVGEGKSFSEITMMLMSGDIAKTALRNQIKTKDTRGRVTRKTNIGIYTEEQMDAKLLAVLGGNFSPPEVHNEFFGHYHYNANGTNHGIHIWFGDPIPFD